MKRSKLNSKLTSFFKINPRFSRYFGDFLLIFCCIVAIVSPCLEQDYPVNHSSHFNLSWAFQYQRQFLGGQFYPRWLEYSNFGFGNATFVFYPPLSLVTTLPFALFNGSVSASLIGSMTIALFVFSVGFYGYAHCFFKQSTTLLLTIASLLNPYFLIDIYQRGAIAEVWGIVWLPWILWSTHSVVKSASPEFTPKQLLKILALAVSYSLLMLSHLPTLLLFTLLWLVLPWCLSRSPQTLDRCSPIPIFRWLQGLPQGVLNSYAGFFLALGLSSFYLVPAYWDQSLVQLQNLHPDADYYPQNRLLITGLTRLLPKVSSHWFDQSIVPYAIVVIVIAVLGVIAVSLDQQGLTRTVKLIEDRSDYLDRQLGEVFWWCLTLGVAIVMVTDLGKIFYTLPFLAKIQFSWRWLSLTIVPVYLLLGYSHQVLQRSLQNSLISTWNQFFFTTKRLDSKSLSTKLCRSLSKILMLSLTGLISLVLFVQSNQILDQTEFNAELIHQFNTLSTQKRYPTEPHLPPQTPFLSWHIHFQDGLGLGDVYEYRAKAVQLPLPSPQPYPLLQWSDPDHNSGPIQLLDWQYGKRSFQVTNLTAQEQRLQLRQLYYPGWQFHLNDSPWQTVFPSADGLAEIPIPPGRHQAIVAYRGTGAEHWGASVTLVCLVLSLAFVVITLGRILT